jgi:hypothetical protein
MEQLATAIFEKWGLVGLVIAGLVAISWSMGRKISDLKDLLYQRDKESTDKRIATLENKFEAVSRALEKANIWDQRQTTKEG